MYESKRRGRGGILGEQLWSRHGISCRSPAAVQHESGRCVA